MNLYGPRRNPAFEVLLPDQPASAALTLWPIPLMGTAAGNFRPSRRASRSFGGVAIDGILGRG